MHARSIAIAIAVTVLVSAFLLLGPRSSVNRTAPPSFVGLPASGVRVLVVPELPRPSSFAGARPCLIDTVSCLALSPEPFAPCLLAVERCSGEGRLHRLGRQSPD